MKLKVLNLLIALYVTGCGAADDQTAPVAQPAPATAAQSPVSVEYPTKPAFTSLAVADASGLPPCDGASEGFLAYVKADKTIQACSGGSWAQIDLRGSKGDPGANGLDGAQGASGKDGTDGKPGSDGKAGETATVTQETVALAANEWVELASGLVWTKSPANVSFDLAKLACDSPGWRLPTETELKRAYALGTLTVSSVWSDSGRLSDPSAAEIMIDADSPYRTGKAYCVRTK